MSEEKGWVATVFGKKAPAALGAAIEPPTGGIHTGGPADQLQGTTSEAVRDDARTGGDAPAEREPDYE